MDSPNKQRPILRVEELNLGMSALGHDSSLAPKNVDQPSQNESVSNERGGTELCEVSDESQRQEYNHLQEDEVLDAEQLSTVRDGQDERLEVLRHEDNVRADEPDLRDRNRGQDGEAHPRSVERAADVSETARHDKFRLHEK